MPGMDRVVLPNYPLHVMQRGHDRQAVFVEDDDFLINSPVCRSRVERTEYGTQYRLVNEGPGGPTEVTDGPRSVCRARGVGVRASDRKAGPRPARKIDLSPYTNLSYFRQLNCFIFQWRARR